MNTAATNPEANTGETIAQADVAVGQPLVGHFAALRIAIAVVAGESDGMFRHGTAILDELRDGLLAVRASRDAWKAYAEHRDSCQPCFYIAETWAQVDFHVPGTLNLCPEGQRLRDAAHAS